MESLFSFIFTVLMIVSLSLIPAVAISALLSIKVNKGKFHRCIKLSGWSLNSRRYYVVKNEARGWFFPLLLILLSISTILFLGYIYMKFLVK
jgi:hypothetical protein